MTIYDRLLMATKESNISLTKLAKEIGIGERSLYNWKTSNPSYETVVKVASYLNVPFDWLLTGNEEKEIDNPLPEPDHKEPLVIDLKNSSFDRLAKDDRLLRRLYISEEEDKLLNSFSQLNEDGKELAFAYIDSLLSMPKFCEKNNDDTKSVPS